MSSTVLTVEVSAFTIAALAGAAVLFSVGVVLIWLGFRNRHDALPSGADDILDAIADGNLAPPSHREYGRDMTGEHVRLVPARPSIETATDGPATQPISVTDGAEDREHDEDDEPAESDDGDDRQPVGVGMLQSDDTGEMPAPARTFFSGQPELKRF